MVNTIWLFMLLFGIAVAGFRGKVEVVTSSALSAAQMAVTIALELIGLMSLWLGLLKLAEAAGLVEALARLLKPVMVRLFPSVPKNHPALGSIIMNLAASMLGLGNAATPFGLKAMKELQTLNDKPDEASEAMCTFLALNTGCITLIPATIIGIRAAAGSIDPAEIVAPTILATSASMLAAVVADRYFRKTHRRNGRRS
ncbi:spore maturation protein [Clostridiales bacterium PH28_bin88]|nr:spore maturation protein [Clostridiales bacterium PH28_bin88]